MRNSLIISLCLLSVLIGCPGAFGQQLEPSQAYSGWFSQSSGTTPMESACGGSSCPNPGGFRWTANCFPRNKCPDDYCPNPFPRQCWPPYPSFYRCVPAGDCSSPGCRDRSTENLSWWFLP